MNVFRKCLKRHIGNSKYLAYMEECKESLLGTPEHRSALQVEKNPVFREMYEELQQETETSLKEKQSETLETIKTALRITRYFFLVLITYILANVLLIYLDLDYYVTCVSILLMGGCFIFKLVEFLSNKYCVLDAYLFMIYKAALEKRSKRFS